MATLDVIAYLLLVLTAVTMELCVATVQQKQDTPADSLAVASNPPSSNSTRNQGSEADQSVIPFQTFNNPVNMTKISANASHAEVAKGDPDQGIKGMNCHNTDKEGIIRFIVIDDDRTKARALLHYFRLVKPNNDLVAAAVSARDDAAVKARKEIANGNLGDAAASLHMGNSSLQLLGVSEYTRQPGFFAYDVAGYPDHSREVLWDLLMNLTDEVPKSVRTITCLVIRVRRTHSILLPAQNLSEQLVNLFDDVANSNMFRKPGKTHLIEEYLLSSENERIYFWMATNFVLGNFAIEPADVDVTRTKSSLPIMPKVTTNMVLDMNEYSVEVTYEIVLEVESEDGKNVTYHKVGDYYSYIGLGTRESILHFIGYDRKHDTLDENNQLTHKTYKTSCLAANLTAKYRFGPLSGIPLVGLGGGGDSCLAQAHEMVSSYESLTSLRDSIVEDKTVYATSEAYNLIKYMFRSNLGNVSHSSTVCPTDRFPCDAYITTVGGIKAAARKICQDPPKNGPEVYYCINMAVFNAVLHKKVWHHEVVVIGLGGQSTVHWPLGLSLLFLQVSMQSASAHFDWVVKFTNTATDLHVSSLGIWTVASALLMQQLVLKHV